MNKGFSRSKLASYIANYDGNMDSLAEELAAFLISEGKTSDLESIMRDVMEYRAVNDGVVELTVTSAFALDQANKQQIEQTVRRIYDNVKQVIIHEIVQPDMVGGVQIKLANASLDLSVRAKLNKLKEAIA